MLKLLLQVAIDFFLLLLLFNCNFFKGFSEDSSARCSTGGKADLQK